MIPISMGFVYEDCTAGSYKVAIFVVMKMHPATLCSRVNIEAVRMLDNAMPVPVFLLTSMTV